MRALWPLTMLSVVALSGSLLVGCGSSDHTDTAILSAENFPDGTEYVRVTDTQAFGRLLTDTLETTTFDPPECKAPRQERARYELEMDAMQAQAQTSAGTRYSTTVATGNTMPASLIEDIYLGDCSTVTAVRTINGYSADSTTYELIQTAEPDGISADRILVLEQTATITSMLPQDTSPPQVLHTLFGYAWIGPYMVSLEQSAAEMTPELRAEFNQLFRTATAKVPQ